MTCVFRAFLSCNITSATSNKRVCLGKCTEALQPMYRMINEYNLITYGYNLLLSCTIQVVMCYMCGLENSLKSVHFIPFDCNSNETPELDRITLVPKCPIAIE